MKHILASNEDFQLSREQVINVYDKLKDAANGHEFVEIGGMLWATMNVGAQAITDCGQYFAWGETQGYTAAQAGVDKQFSWADYRFNPSGDGETMTKYNDTDGKTVLDLEDDAVHANWGGGWRMPTKEELVALSNAVTTEWTDDYDGSGHSGYVLTDKTDSNKKLFFPAGGYGNDGSVYYEGSEGYYWSSSQNASVPHSTYGIFFDSGDQFWDYDDARSYGFQVRGILDIPDSQLATFKDLKSFAKKSDLDLIRVVNVSSNLTDQTTNAAPGQSETVIYKNAGSTAYTVAISTDSAYKTPDGQAITINCPAGGYCEVNYLKIDNNTIYVRGI